MSNPVKAHQLDYLSNRNMEDLVISNDDTDDEFDFKYLSKSQLEHIVNDVRRQRTKTKEENEWPSLVRRDPVESSEDDDDDFDCTGVSNVKKLLRRRADGTDRGSKRSKTNSPPERMRIVSRNGSTSGSSTPRTMESPSARLRCSVSELGIDTRKFDSEHELRSSDESPDGSDRVANGSTGRREDSDDDDDYYARPRVQAAQKILGIQKKISNLLDDIEFGLDKIALPDGDRDLRRRVQRGTEFTIRFSRNYLYDLGRKILDLRRLVSATLSGARVKPSPRGSSLRMDAIERKLMSAHQLLFNALSAYCKHVPSLVLRTQPGKLKEILRIIVELRDICVKVHLTTDYYGCGDAGPAPLGNDIEKRCNEILLKLTGGSDVESRLVGRTEESGTTLGLRNKKIVCGNDNRKNLPGRLSMYSVDQRLTTNPGRRRPDAPLRSRYTRPSSVITRTPPNHRPSTPYRPNISQALRNSPIDVGKRTKTKIRSPQREDEISTMMSALAADSDAASSVTVSGYSRASLSIRDVSNSRKCFSTMVRSSPPAHLNPSRAPVDVESSPDDEQRTERQNAITDRQLSSLVPVIADLMTLVTNKNDVAIRRVPSDSMQALMTVLRKHRSSNNPDIDPPEKLNVDEQPQRGATSRGNSGESVGKPIGKRRGVKNMELICCTPRENVCATSDFVATNKRCEKNLQQTQNRSSKLFETMENRKIKTLTMSEKSVRDVSSYRNEYQCSSSSNPMYTNNGRNKPWNVVAWIADNLVDELIVDVSEELQMKDAMHELFVLEFKEFQLSSQTTNC